MGSSGSFVYIGCLKKGIQDKVLIVLMVFQGFRLLIKCLYSHFQEVLSFILIRHKCHLIILLCHENILDFISLKIDHCLLQLGSSHFILRKLTKYSYSNIYEILIFNLVCHNYYFSVLLCH